MTTDTGSDVEKLWLLVVGVLLVTMPALTLFVAYAVLSATRSVVLEQVTLVEAAELYLIELVAFGVFSYVLYRLTRYLLRKELTGEQGDDEQTDDEPQQNRDRSTEHAELR
ncbi:hypothetical protein SAMN04487948_11296 [Halogranum amylolyticum]|uniref:Uncharacterized protein n=1 Tax=Halogranum amylolyticum TaxID=660520 RepID=A0A1H8UT22_9EURY|nr:hypothetical protein [Halogranum amylolyticum]SEP06276.1 hypothetical protein SAMN04487948_11296 [Halogranum amylolyticum]